MSAKVVRLGPDGSVAPVRPVLDVLLLYEDFGTALRATHSLDLLPVSFITESGMHTNLWRLDLLAEPLLRDQATREAAAADLIILSLHGHDGLPANAVEWLNCWLNYKENRPYALAVLLDPGTPNAGPDHPVVAHVKQIAAAAAADLFYSFCQTPIPAAQSGPAGISPSPRAA